jgi:hypothetical protein
VVLTDDPTQFALGLAAVVVEAKPPRDIAGCLSVMAMIFASRESQITLSG